MSAPVREPPLSRACARATAETRHFESLGNNKHLPNGRYGARFCLERVPIKWNHLIDKDSLKIKELEHVLIEKVEQLFRDMLFGTCSKGEDPGEAGLGRVFRAQGAPETADALK